MPIWLVLFAVLLPLLIGSMLLICGLRGRAMDDHPICRRCRFDLFGLPPGGKKCSECGADLSLARAVRIGNRRKRPGLATLGALLMLPAVAGLGLLAWASIGDVKWIEHAPDWFVVRQSNSAVAADRDPALKELTRRLIAGELSDPRIAGIADAQLTWQADDKTPWVIQRGDLIDAARAAGKLPDDKWKQYVRNAVQYQLVARPQVRRGDDVIVRITESSARCGSRTRIYRWTESTLGPSDLATAERNRLGGRNNSSSFGAGSSGSTGHRIVLDPKLLANAAEGTKTLRMKLKVDLYDRDTDGTPPEVASKSFDLQTTWDLVAADAPTVKAVEDPSARAAVEKSIGVRQISVNRSSPQHANLMIDVRSPPVALAYRVILRAGGREWPVGSIYVSANSNSSWGTGGPVTGLDPNVVDVVLRPDRRTALDTVDMHEYWTGEVVIKNVPVTRAGQ